MVTYDNIRLIKLFNFGSEKMGDYADAALDLMKLLFWLGVCGALLFVFILSNSNDINADGKNLSQTDYVIKCFQNGNVVATENITGELDSAWFKNGFSITTNKGDVSIFNGEFCIATSVNN